MSRFTLSLRAAVFGLAALVAPAALRAQTTTSKVFYACYVPSSGSVYRIKEADLMQECSKSTHVQFSWTDGTSTPGFSEIKTVYSPSTTIPASGQGYAIADCPAGYKAIGGSYYVLQSKNLLTIRASVPSGAGTSWVVEVVNTDPGAVLQISAVAQCVK
jgi:hypothetical protein